jgi:D-3-phosphoglycerate dehydrogenase / 2-oxoglutarate reductase
MKVIAFDPVLSHEKATSLGVELVSVDDLFRRADFITVHAPLTADTKGLLGASAFEKMKTGVLIVNAARGGIVDEEALAVAIKQGKVGGAALDVFVKEPVDPQHPLLQLEQVVVTPHLGASTHEAQDRVATEICEQVIEYFQEGTIRNAVNVPSVEGDAAQRLRPYIELGKKLGSLLSQLDSGSIRELRVTCSGEPGELGVRAVANSTLAGFLERFVEEPINAISAPFEAKERGIAVAEVREEATRRYTSMVRVSIYGESGVHTATGTLGMKDQPLLVGLDGYELDATLEGRMIVMHNEDRPGVIGAVGTIMGKREINVSRMQLGLHEGQAVALWNVDNEVPSDALDELRKLPNVRSVLLVKL